MSLSGCREIEELLFDYLDGNLDNRIKASVEAHLASCESCRTELERCRSTLKLLASAKAVPPQDFVKNVMTNIDHERNSVPETHSAQFDKSDAAKPVMVFAHKRPFRFRYGTVAAAVLLVAALAAGWRVLPAFMNADMSKNDSAEYGSTLTSGSDAETEALQQSLYSDSDAANGSDTYADDTEQMLMFAAPSLRAEESVGETLNNAETGKEDNMSGGGAANDVTDIVEGEVPAITDNNDRLLTPSAGKYGIEAVTPEQLITQYAPAFDGLATEVVIIYTDKPINDRPFASAQVDGDGYTAFLIDDSTEAVKTAESLAATLGAEIYGTAGSGLVWIEIY